MGNDVNNGLSRQTTVSGEPMERETEAEKMRNMRETPNSRPSGFYDQKVDPAMKLRKERLEVAERMGMDKEKALKHILDLEKSE